MRQTYNVYCDESSHLERDHQRVMVLGAIWCPAEKSHETFERLREIKARHTVSPHFEAKWKKVSPGGALLYLDLIDYFFDDDDLSFRAVVIPDKSMLRHAEYDQSHDDWYYKMYFVMLSAILDREHCYRIYLDIKDSQSHEKVEKLHEVLANSRYDFSREIIERVQTVRSEEVELVQLADLLIGAVSYANRELESNEGKLALVNRVRQRSRYSLTKNTLLRERKFNLLIWQAS